jgi:peptidoglycan/LPS O-acetylase OafA/YrhL
MTANASENVAAPVTGGRRRRGKNQAQGAAVEQKASPTRARILGLDGARGLSAIGVLIGHVAGYYPSNSRVADQISAITGVSLIFFFALAGFLLFLPYVRALTEDPTSPKGQLPSTKYYALHRFARVFPVYVVIFLITNYVLKLAYVTNPMLYPAGSLGGTGMITEPGKLIANLTLMQTYFPQYFQTGLNPSWSLTMEYGFYAALPLLCVFLFALRKRISARPLTVATIGVVILILMGFVGKLLVPAVIPDYDTMDPWLLNWGPNWGAVYLRSFPVNADSYAFGMLAAIVIVAMERGDLRESLSRRVRLYSLLAIPVTAVLFVVMLTVERQFETTAFAMLSTVVILVMVAPLALGQNSMLANLLENAVFKFTGKVSLSVCLWHYPVLLLLGRWGFMETGSVPGLVKNMLLVLIVTFLVSAVSYYCVEQPAMNVARRYGNRWR